MDSKTFDSLTAEWERNLAILEIQFEEVKKTTWKMTAVLDMIKTGVKEQQENPDTEEGESWL